MDGHDSDTLPLTSAVPTFSLHSPMPHHEANGAAGAAHTPAMAHVPTHEVATQTNDIALHTRETTPQTVTLAAFSSTSASPSSLLTPVTTTSSSTSTPIPVSSQTSVASAHSAAPHARETTVQIMPAPRSKRAPKLFKGDEEDIAEFLEAYEFCANDARLPENQRVKVIFRYLHWSQ